MSISYLRTQTGQILFVLLLWVVQILFINPHGEFPSNDDWAYALSVQEAIEHGRFFVSGWTAVNLFAQIGWGSLFCLPFGFSFTALRISTLVAGGLGLWGTYKLLNETTNQSTALAGSLLMAANPIYLGLSATFMTDIPFYAVAIWAYYFLVLGLKNDAMKPILIGLSLGIVSLLIRQFGVVVFLSFSLAYIIRRGFNWRSIFIALTCSVGAVLIQIGYQKWLIWILQRATAYNVQSNNILNLNFLSSNFLHDFTNNVFIMIVYLGMFLFPFLIIMAATGFHIFRRSIWLIGGLSILIFSLWIFLFDGAKMIIWWNIINVHGLGPLAMRDVYFHLYNLPVPVVLQLILLGLTGFSLVGGVVILLYLIRLLPILIWQNMRSDQRAIGVLLLSAGVIYCGPLALQGLFDRYLLFPIPLLVILIHQVSQHYNHGLTSSLSKPLLYVSVGLYAVYWLFSVGATHDYLAWNRVRWQALNTMMKQDRIPPTEIDGGLEFNGLYLYNEAYKMTPEKSFWWVERDTYVVGASLLPGYAKFRGYEVNRWLPWGIENIVVGKKQP